MSGLTRRGVFASLGAASLAALLGVRGPARANARRRRRLLLLGASNTWGWVDGQPSRPHRMAYKDHLRAELRGWDVTVRAFFGGGGVDWPPTAAYLPSSTLPIHYTSPLLYGESGPDELRRGFMHPWRNFALPNLPCDVAVLMVAVGDALRGALSPTPEEYREAMLATCIALLEHGAKHVLLPVDTPVRQPGNIYGWQAVADRVAAYRDEIFAIWAMGIDGIVPGPDLWDELTTPGWGYFGQDWLHPNEVGHRKMADLYLSSLRSIE